MRKQIILHIGTFKTGTSAIQHYLKSHAADLVKQGVFVPDARLTGHHELPLSLLKDLTKFKASWPDFKRNWKDVWDDVFGQIASTNCEVVVLSSENFCDLVNEHARGQSDVMADILRQYFGGYDVKVVVYLRQVNDYVRSMYGEMIKVSNTEVSINELVQSYVKHKSIHVCPSSYLNYYSGLFGKDNIEVYPYDVREFDKGDVVDHFLKVIGVTRIDAKGSSEKKVNASLGGESLALKMAYNVAGLQGYEHNKNISNILLALERSVSAGGGFEYSESEMQFLDRERERVLREYGVDLGVYNPENMINDGGASLQERFIVSLLSFVIKQNQHILNRISNLEKK